MDSKDVHDLVALEFEFDSDLAFVTKNAFTCFSAEQIWEEEEQ